MNIRSLALAVVLAAAAPVTLTACGPKKPSTEDGVVNPTQAFIAGVTILGTPNKDGDLDYQAAYVKFTDAATAKPDYAKAHFNAGWTSERMGNLDTAASHYQDALNADPSFTKALYALGDMLSRLNRGEEAVTLTGARRAQPVRPPGPQQPHGGPHGQHGARGHRAGAAHPHGHAERRCLPQPEPGVLQPGPVRHEPALRREGQDPRRR